MKKKFYFIFLLSLLCFSMAQAETFNINDSSVTITANENYTIIGTGTPTSNTITVNAGVTAAITLQNVNIDVSGTENACAFDMSGASVMLSLSDVNTLKSGKYRAGLQAPGGSMLAISSKSGGGSTSGTLNVTGGASGAGIGGGNEGSGGNVDILGGTINATGGGYAAAIGGGDWGNTGGVITISGGAVNVTGGASGAGIGGGYESSGGTIKISGGALNATGGYGSAGIGGGDGGEGGDITISGGAINATGGTYAAAIGGGCYCNSGTIIISGGTINATGGSRAAGIGGGYRGIADITISGGFITAITQSGGGDPATIGGGGECIGGATVNVKGGVVVAISGTGPAIGSPNSLAYVNISGGTIITSGRGMGGGLNTAPTITGAPIIFATAINGTSSNPSKGIVVGNDVTITLSGKLPDCTGTITPHVRFAVPLQALFTVPTGWTLAADAGLMMINGTIINNGTMTAQLSIYTVSFDMNGHGAPIDPITHIVKTSRLLAVQPADPKEMLYTFGGWYKDSGCTNPWNFSSDNLMSDITLYAKWTAGFVTGVNPNKDAVNQPVNDTDPEPWIHDTPEGGLRLDSGLTSAIIMGNQNFDVSNFENACALYIPPTAHPIIYYIGVNNFKSSGSSAGIQVSEGASLTLFTDEPDAILNVWGGLGTGKHSGAGIGGGEGQNCGTITFGLANTYSDSLSIISPGGTVNAYGFYDGVTNYSSAGAGIGGGGFDPSSASPKAGNGGTVIIYGGTITAVGGGSPSLLGEGAAGIGGGSGDNHVPGSGGSGGSVTIYSGGNYSSTVNAVGGWNGAGVGGGFYGSGGDVVISGGTVNAVGGFGAAGIGGGGWGSSGGTVTISSGTVTATGGAGGAGIGGGGAGVVATGGSEIAISGGAVIAVGGEYGAGLGGGRDGLGGNVAISGGTVIAANSGGNSPTPSIEGAPVIFATDGIPSTPENGIATGNDVGINPSAKLVTLHTDFIVPAAATLTVPAEWTLNHTNHSLTNSGIIINNGSIVPPIVTGVSLNKNEVELYFGNSDTLTAVVAPSGAANRVNWKSIGDTVALTPLGDTSCRLTGASIGRDTVWVKTADGGKTDSCIVTVSKAPQRITGFFPEDTTILLGAQINIPVTSGASGVSVTYTNSNPATATIEDNLITAVGLGTTVITANQAGNNNYNPAPELTCRLTVVSALVTDVCLNKNAVSLPVGSSDTLRATVLPNNVTNKNVTWVRSAGSITIETLNDTSCVITRASAGTTSVWVITENNHQTDLCMVTDEPVPVTGIELNKSTVNLYVGDRDTLTATVSPLDATNRNITFFVQNDAVVSISRFGNTKYVITGESARRTAVLFRTEDGGKTKSCVVIVSKRPQNITGFFPADTAILLGDHINLSEISSSGLDVNYESSNLAAATVNGNLITAVGLGTTVITANQAGNRYYDPAPELTCTLTVNPVPVAGVSLNEHTLELRIGAGETLTATVSPANATNPAIIWSSGNASAATVDNDGLVHAVGEGTAWITATSDYDNGIADSCAVTVLKKTQNITDHSYHLKTYGDSPFTLQAQVASGLPVRYTIASPPQGEPPVAELSGEHKSTVTIHNKGNVLIYAHQDGDGDHEAAMSVSATLIVDKATLTVTPDAGQRKTVGEADPAEFTYQCSGWKYNDNENLLTGYLSRVAGEDGGEYDFTQDNLSAGNNYDIVIAPDVKFTIDKIDQSITGFLPADTAVRHRTPINLSAISSSGLPVNYESSNTDLAIIENNNLITTVGAGTVVITAGQAGNHYYNPAPALTCALTVHPIPVTSVSLNSPGLFLPNDSTVQLTLTVLPPDATNPAVIWSSGNESVATVDNNGLVHAVGEGAARITATSDYDNGKTASCLVMVIPATALTGISTVGESSSAVFVYDGILYIDSPAAERIEVYTLLGKLLHRADKPAGTASFAIPNPEQLLVVRGSSGWMKKIEDK